MRHALIVLTLLITMLAVGACGNAPTATPLPTVAPTDMPTATPEPAATATSLPEPTAEPATAPTEDGNALLNENVESGLAKIEQPEGDTVAIVNGVDIPLTTYNEFMRLRMRAMAQQSPIDWGAEESADMLTSTAFQVYTQLIDVEILRQAAEEEDLLPSEDEMTTMRETIQSQIVASGQYAAWEDFLVETGVSEDTFERIIGESIVLQKMVDAHSEIEDAEQIHALHILVSDEELAKEIITKLADGEDFATLANAHSEDPGSAAAGGDLGWFPRGVMVPEFESAAFALEVDEVSDIVTTTYGYHIIKTLAKETRPLEPPYDEMAKNQVFEQWYLGLSDKAEVEHLLFLQ